MREELRDRQKDEWVCSLEWEGSVTDQGPVYMEVWDPR